MSERTAPPFSWLGGIGDAFSDRNFRIYSIGSLISWITYFIQEIAFSWATWRITQSPAWLAAVALLTTGAMMALVPLGGAVADRHDRFRVAMAAYACDALKACVLAVLAFENRLTLPVVCVAALLHGVFHSFSIPAAYGLMPRFVAPQRLASAIGVNAAYTQFAVFAGPAIAGFILVRGGLAVAFAANALGYAAYFVTASLLKAPAGFTQPKLPRRTLAADISQGVAYVRAHQGLRALLALGLAADAVTKAVYGMLPAAAGLMFGGGAGDVALFYGAAGLGATVSALWIAHGGAARVRSGRILWAALGVGLAVAGFALAPSRFVAAAAMFGFGFAAETRRTGAVAMIQSTVEDSQRGRVMSTLFLFAQIAGAAGTLGVGVSASGLGLRGPLLAAAAVLALAWAWSFARRGEIAAAFARDQSLAASRARAAR